MPDRNANVRRPLGTRFIRENRRRTWELERQPPPDLPSHGQLADTDPEGFLDSGFGYHHDYDTGLMTPSRAGIATFSWLDPPAVGLMSGCHRLTGAYVGKLYEVSCSCLVGDTAEDAEITFYLNGTNFAVLTLTHPALLAKQGLSVATTGADTDVLQAELTSYAGSTLSTLVADVNYI